jgi:hypothetical protein
VHLSMHVWRVKLRPSQHRKVGTIGVPGRRSSGGLGLMNGRALMVARMATWACKCCSVSVTMEELGGPGSPDWT